MSELLTVKAASAWASKKLGTTVTPSNISYLIQYGQVAKVINDQRVMVNKNDLEKYYAGYHKQEQQWKKELGDDVNWSLSFSQYKEYERTKHVHRLHPYKGKFIPQLVEYFLDEKTDKFKKEVFFNPGDVVLDPFCGSGTTLVQANELGMHAVGVDISSFNAFISNTKIGEYDIDLLIKTAENITEDLRQYVREKGTNDLERDLLYELKVFNDKYFPSPDFRYKVRRGLIDEKAYGEEKAAEFKKTYSKYIKKYAMTLKQDGDDSFLEKWYLAPVRDEIDYAFNLIRDVEDTRIKKILALTLSRTMRSCRATTHADLGTLIEPTLTPYYCKKHGKVCKPLFSMLGWWTRYTKDTIKRVYEFSRIRSGTFQHCLDGDSRAIDIEKALIKKKHPLGEIVKKQGINGIFSSPPYVGLIDYHEQHAYAYDLFDFERNDELEIGPLYSGQGAAARESYVRGIADVLNNSKRFLSNDYNVFLVANDKHGLYPKIAELAGMTIVNEYHRPVLNRVEKDRSAYSEKIFHLREGQGGIK